MLSGNLFQFDEFQSENHQQQQPINDDAAAVGDIRDYLTCDLKLSDTALNDLFSDFDLAANDFSAFDPIPYSHMPIQSNLQAPINMPPSYDTVLLSNNPNTMPPNSHLSTNQPYFDDYLSSNTLKSLLEQHHVQQSTVKYSSSSSSSPSPPLPMQQANFSDTSSLLSSDMSENPSTKMNPVKKQPTSKRTRPSPPVHLHKLIKKPEPIPVTFDQFQALICSAPDTSAPHMESFSSLLENSTIIGNNIPLKIVNQNNQMGHLSSDENSRHDSPMGSHGHFGNGHGRGRRKSSHNAIEKRYRSSINERILELKEIVAADDEKVQKSGVLRRTLEFIRQLQSINRRLEDENSTLKTILKRINLTTADLPINHPSPSSDRGSSVKHLISPPLSNSDSNDSTLGSSDEAFSPLPKRQKRTTSKQGMVNGSRLVLCCFMLCVLITNPFSYLLNLIHASEYNDATELRSIVASRTLQSAATTNENIHSSSFLSTSWRQLVAWMLNLAICLVCLVKLFVYGEPIVSDAEMQEYYVYKKKADQLMAENLPNEARVYYRQCCEKLFVTIDHSLLYYLSSITWQMTRFCVNLILVGRWLTFWSGWTKSIDTRDYNRELNDCLLQLWKIEYQHSTSSLALFNLFISTINTSMNAGKKVACHKRNEIYCLSAFTLKKLGGVYPVFIPYVLKCLQLTDFNDFWLVDLERLTQFIFDKETILFERGQFIESIRQQYLDYVLDENIRNHLLGEDETPQTIVTRESTDLDGFSWWQHSLQVIRCISDERQSIDSIASSDLLRRMEESNPTIYHTARATNLIDERFISVVETIHSILLVLNDDDDQTKSTRVSLLEQLGHSSRSIVSMIDSRSSLTDELDLARKALIIDGILALRLRLLTSAMTSPDEKLPYLNDFQQELDQYRSLNRMMKLPKQRLYLFESIFRVSSGLNPLTMQTVFEGALKQQTSHLQSSQESPNLDIVAALLLFCHFSPSTVFHYRTLLQQAATISSSSKKNNDLDRLRQQCLTLIRQPYLTL